MNLKKPRWWFHRISAQLLKFFYPAKPTQLVRPFVPGPLSAYGRGTKTYFTVGIENSVSEPFQDCYARIVEFIRTDQPGEGLPQQGDNLLWGTLPDRAQESIPIDSNSGATITVASVDRSDPGHFQVPIGINATRTLDTQASYEVTVEVGSAGSSATPLKFKFSIKPDEERIQIGEVTQLE